MKKTNTSKNKKEEMRSEYDFSGKTGVRGKYYQDYSGHTVRIHKANGTVTTQHFTLQEGAVMLEPEHPLSSPLKAKNFKYLWLGAKKTEC